MTKQLTPIEELALATGLILKTTNLELCPSYLTKLEKLRQAIIEDFVSVVKSECDKLSESSKIAKGNIYHSGIEDALSVMAIVASMEA